MGTCKDFFSSTLKKEETFSRIFSLATRVQETAFTKWGTIAWKTESGKIFFFRMNRVNKIFSFDLVMMGSEEDCAKVHVNIEIINPETKKLFFMSTFNPRPITTTNSEELCLLVKQGIISKNWHYNQTEKAYDFTVSVQVLSYQLPL